MIQPTGTRADRSTAAGVVIAAGVLQKRTPQTMSKIVVGQNQPGDHPAED